MERVLGIDTQPDAEGVRTEVIDLAIQPWLAGVAVAAVQLTTGGVAPRRARQKSRR